MNNNSNFLITQNINNTKDNKNNSEMLIETIITNYLVSKWRNNIFLKKFEVRGFNQKRAQLKKGFSLLGKVFDIKKLMYLFKIFDTMINMPQKQGVNHDIFYGKIKIINKRFKSDEHIINKQNNNNTKVIENNKTNKIVSENNKKTKINKSIKNGKKKENNSQINIHNKRNKSTNLINYNKVNQYNNRPNNKIKNFPKKDINKSKINQKLNLNDSKSINKKNNLKKAKNLHKSNNYFYPTNIKSSNYNIYKNNVIDKNRKLNNNFSYINRKSSYNNKTFLIIDKKNNKSHINSSADNITKKNKKFKIPNVIANSNNFYFNNSYAQKYIKKKVYERNERNNNNKFINPRLFNYNYNKDQNRLNGSYNIFY